jgi:hypothetical protein
MMKAILILLAVGSACAAVASAAAVPPSPAALSTLMGSAGGSPFACNRLALDPVARKRHFDELGPALRDQIRGVHELTDGYEFEFSADPATVQQVAEWAAGERLCCPFFDIAMEMVREGGPLWLRLSGRAGTKQFIAADGASWLEHPRVTR